MLAMNLVVRRLTIYTWTAMVGKKINNVYRSY